MSLLHLLNAYWKFEEGASPSVDATGRGNALEWVQGTAQGQGVVGYGLYTNISGSYARRDSNDDLQPGAREDFTVCGWFKLNEDLDNQILCCIGAKVNVWLLQLSSVDGHHIEFLCYHAGGAVTVRVESPWSPLEWQQEWFFYRAWRAGNTISLQVNCGTTQSQAFDYDLVQAPLNIFFIGGGPFGGNVYTNGYHDSVGVWARALENYEADQLCGGDEYPFGECAYLAYGTYAFPRTFHAADDNLEWLIPSIKAGRRHGGHSLAATLREKRLTVRGGFVKGPVGGVTILRDEIDDLRAALGLQPQNLYFSPDRYWRNVRVELFRNPYGPTHYCRIAGEIEVQFVTEDPFQYAVLESSDTWSSPTTGATRAISVGGNADSLPAIALTVAGSGAQTIDFALENETTGERFTLSGSVLGGEAITIDSLLQTVVNGESDAIDLFDGQFLTFRGDVDNTLEVTITSGTITSIVTTWRNRWY